MSAFLSDVMVKLSAGVAICKFDCLVGSIVCFTNVAQTDIAHVRLTHHGRGIPVASEG